MPFHKETPFLSAIMFFDNRLFLTVLFFWTYVLFCTKYNVCVVLQVTPTAIITRLLKTIQTKTRRS